MADDYQKEVEDEVFRAIAYAAVQELQHANVTMVPIKVPGLILRRAAQLAKESPNDRNMEAAFRELADSGRLSSVKLLRAYVEARYKPAPVPSVEETEA